MANHFSRTTGLKNWVCLICGNNRAGNLCRLIKSRANFGGKFSIVLREFPLGIQTQFSPLDVNDIKTCPVTGTILEILERGNFIKDFFHYQRHKWRWLSRPSRSEQTAWEISQYNVKGIQFIWEGGGIFFSSHLGESPRKICAIVDILFHFSLIYQCRLSSSGLIQLEKQHREAAV